MGSLDDYVEAFELLGDWDQRYQYLTELGEQMQPLPEQYRVDENKVKGCMSQVWVHAYTDPDRHNRVFFHADCDTATIKGVLALLVDLMSDKTVKQVQDVDLDRVFERLNLYDHLSPNRHVGIYAIVDMMKRQAGLLGRALPA
jgi:cysteine desulfuration protein SufE